MSKLWLPSRRHLAERLAIDRRAFLAEIGLSASALAAMTLGACNSDGPHGAQAILRGAERWNERVERGIFRHTSMNVPSSRARSAGPRFPSYFVSDDVPRWNEKERGIWRLEVAGLVKRPLRLTLADLKALPRAELRLEHFCVEGWSAVATRTGVPLAELARRAGVAGDAQYVDFQSFDDDYHESWDIDSALHPQTLIVYGQDGRLLDPAFGAPARVYGPTKLGYKNTKYLRRIEFRAERNGGYWSDQGYEWYGGV